MPKMCRVGDTHACGDVDTTGSPNAFANGLPIHRVTDQHEHDITQVEGSPNYFVNGLPVARVGDNQGGPDKLGHPPNPQVTGSPNIFVNGR